MHSAYKLNKKEDNIQPWCTPFPILNQSIISCPVASWPPYRFLRRQIRWSDIYISLRIFHSLLWATVKGFPGGSDGNESTCNAGDLVQSLDWKDSLRRTWQSSPVSVPGEPPRTAGSQRLAVTERLSTGKQKGFSWVSEAKAGVCLHPLTFSMAQWMLEIWSLVSLPFLHVACTSGCSQLMCY